MLINSINLKKIWHTIFYVLIFLIPTNLFYKFNLSEAYVNNLLVDYLIPKIYLVDLVAIFFLVYSLLLQYFLKIKIIDKKLFYKLIPFFLLTSIAIDFNYTNSIITALRFSLYFIFTIIVFKNRIELINKNFSFIYNLSIIFQSFISIYQYYFQKSFYGYLFFGESNLNNYYGIAKTTFFDDSRILPYGTTPHPNILAGFMAVFIIYNLIKKNKNYFDYLCIFLSIFTILMTESLSALLTILIGLTIFSIKKIKKNNYFSLSLIFFISFFVSIFAINYFANYSKNQSLIRRNYLNEAAIKIIIEKPISGTKLNGFTREVENHSKNIEVVRFVQPVHNFFLLALSEFGILPIVLLSIYLIILHKKLKIIDIPKSTHLIFFIAIIPVLNLDHYFYTIPAGNLSLILLMLSVIQPYDN